MNPEHLCPVTGWSISPVENQNAITLQVDFIVNPGKSSAEMHESCHLLLTNDQAFALTWAIHQGMNQEVEDS